MPKLKLRTTRRNKEVVEEEAEVTQQQQTPPPPPPEKENAPSTRVATRRQTRASLSETPNPTVQEEDKKKKKKKTRKAAAAPPPPEIPTPPPQQSPPPRPPASSRKQQPKKKTTTSTENNITLNVSPATAQEIREKRPVVRLHRYVTRRSTGADPPQPSPPQEQQPPPPQNEDPPAAPRQQQRGAARRKKRLRVEQQGEEEEDDENNGRNGSESPVHDNNILLPSVELFPLASDANGVQIQKMREVKGAVCGIFSLIMNQVQEDEDCYVPCYESVEKVYEFFDNSVVGKTGGWGEGEEAIVLGDKYRNVCIGVLWGFGAVVWRQNVARGPNKCPYSDRVARFLEYCFVHLGWNLDRRKPGIMVDWKNEKYPPASYLVVKLFHKYNSDSNSLSRQSQLTIMNKLLECAVRNGNYEYIRMVWETVGRNVLIRVKDKSAACRLLALKILSYFVMIEEAVGICQKELKYYTRYDPFVEVRRLGTRILAEKTRIKLRFFFDQAFDKRESVRVEAFKAMGIEMEKEEEEYDDDEEVDEEEMDSDGEREGEGTERRESSGERVEKPKEYVLVREMNSLASDKLCKTIVWGALHSGAKCNEIVKSEILPKWLEISCKGDIVKFLQNIDAFQHMKAVVKILDILLTTKDQERFVESLDLSFIGTLKTRILAKDYKNVCIEYFVAWLGLCKASEMVETIRGKVVPSPDEMLVLVEALQQCVYLEHVESKEVDRNEDITPIFLLVIALEVAKRFVAWEEGNRRQFVKLVEKILTDPLLDERVIIIQAIQTIHSFIDELQFEDLMMGVFQDVFDSNNMNNRSGIAGNMSFWEFGRGDGEIESEQMSVHSSGGRRRSLEGEENVEDEDEEIITPEPVAPPPPPPVVPKNAYELTKMRAKLCDLAMTRLKLQNQKQEFVNKKMFIDAIPINAQIIEVQDQEAELANELKEQEAYAKRVDEERRARGEQALANNNVDHEDVRRSFVAAPAAAVAASDMVDEGVEGDLEATDDEMNVSEGSGGGRTESDGRRPVISSLEEGLSKGMLMINAYLDLVPKMGPFIRNLYEAYVTGFMSESDLSIKVSVMQFLARIGMIDKREFRKVFWFMFGTLLQREHVELKNVAFQAVVDLIVCYEYSDLCFTEEEKLQPADMHHYTHHLTRYLSDMMPGHEGESYGTCTPELMEKVILDMLTKRFPPTDNSLNVTEWNILNTSKNIGLLKLLVRGRIRDPVVVSKILCLWVNQDYAGTAVLRDLEHVLKLYATFEWWGDGGGDGLVEEIDGEITNEEFSRCRMMRVLGVAVGEGVIALCQDQRVGGTSGVVGGGRDSEDVIGKFIGYFVSFLDHYDQPLMRTIVTTILSPILSNPARSYNSLLARYASKIPLTSPVSASRIVHLIGDIFVQMKEHPMTTSVCVLRKELLAFIAKLKRVFGDEIAKIRDANGRERIVGNDFGWEDSVADEEEEEEVVSFGDGSSVGRVHEEEERQLEQAIREVCLGDD